MTSLESIPDRRVPRYETSPRSAGPVCSRPQQRRLAVPTKALNAPPPATGPVMAHLDPGQLKTPGKYGHRLLLRAEPRGILRR